MTLQSYKKHLTSARNVIFLDLHFFFFYLGEPARLRGRRFQALQTHTHGPTWGNVFPSRRAVGLSATMILAIHFRRGEQSFTPTTRYQTIFYNRKGQNHFRFNPSRTPARTFSPFRGEPPNSLARNFSPRREHRDPDQPAGNDNASVPGYRAFSPDRAVFANVVPTAWPNGMVRAAGRG